jgi:hypothetical protein
MKLQNYTTTSKIIFAKLNVSYFYHALQCSILQNVNRNCFLSFFKSHKQVPAAMLNPGKDGLPAIDAKYSKVGESLRYNTPSEMQCSMFCGGRRCKYESAANWKPEDMAVNGLYSHWITDEIVIL